MKKVIRFAVIVSYMVIRHCVALAILPINPGFSANRTVPLTGDYTIGGMGAYPTITAAVNDLNQRGVAGPVRFLLTDAGYNIAETYPIVIEVSNANLPTEMNPVTIKPATGVTSTISGSSPNLQVFSIRTSYVTIDGSNTVSGTSRDLTINNTSTTNPQVIGLHNVETTPLVGSGVINCNLINGAIGSQAVIASQLVGAAGYFHDITIRNNNIQTASTGIYARAVVSPGNGSGLQIEGNDLNTPGTLSIRRYGILVTGVDGALVTGNHLGNMENSTELAAVAGIWFGAGTVNSSATGNTISGISGSMAPTRGIVVLSAVSNANINISGNIITGITGSSSSANYGILISNATSGVIVQKNRISNVRITTGNGIAAGIGLSSTLNPAGINVRNNYICDVAGYGSSSLTGGNGYGINISSGGGYTVCFNSINLATSQTSATGCPACLIISSTVASGSLDVRDNIFAIPATIGTNRYAVICNAAASVFSAIDYNDYFTSGPNLCYLGGNVTGLSSWRMITGSDNNSVSGNPAFVSACDLHIMPGMASPVRDAGTALASVTDDIDGNMRGNPPDIGASEDGYIGPSVSGTAVNTSCFGYDDGSISILVNNGFMPYGYAWSNGATTANLTGIPAGIYTVTVTDAIYSHATGSWMVADPPPLTCSITIQGPSVALYPEPLQLNAAVSNFSSLLWSTTGTGNFDDPTVLNPVYTPGAGDSGSPVTFCLEAFPVPPCIMEEFDCETVTFTGVDTCAPSCCAISLVLVNDSSNTRPYRKIRVTTLGSTEIITIDPDDFIENRISMNSVEFSAESDYLPVGDAIESQPVFYFRQAGTQSFMVEWFDADLNIVCRHEINIPCRLNPPEDDDWPAYTTITGLNDPMVFAFAFQQEIEDEEDPGDCGYIDRSMKSLTDDCPFSSSIKCDSNRYAVTLHGPGGFNKYYWTITDLLLNTSVTILSTIDSITVLYTDPGLYLVGLISVNTLSKDTCLANGAIKIPKIRPDAFEWKQSPCSREVTFEVFFVTEYDDNYTWSCAGLPDFPEHGATVSYLFPMDSTFHVTLTITDIYGCVHSATKSVYVSLTSQPDFHVSYSRCACDDSVPSKTAYQTQVHFFNDSKGIPCPVTWLWNFGDGQTSTEFNPVHIYNTGCPGPPYIVTLTMTDSQQNSVTKTDTILIETCMNDFSYYICPDGKVELDAGNIYGIWELPNGVEIAPWPYSDEPISWPAMPTGNKEKMYRNLIASFPVSGDYVVTFTGYVSENFLNGGTVNAGCLCTMTKTIHVELSCCAKNDGKRGRYYFSEAGKDYKMEYKFIQRQFPVFVTLFPLPIIITYHRIIGNTTLEFKKIIRGHSHWKNSRPDEIEASFDGNIYARGDAGCHCYLLCNCMWGCNCVDAKTARDTKLRYNRSKATFNFHTQGRFRSKFESLESNHRIRLGSREIEHHLNLGQDCDTFHWWADWY